MKNKKLFIILGIIIVLFIITSVVCFLSFKKDKYVEEVLSFGIVQKKYLAYEDLRKKGNNFIVEKDDKYGLLNSDFEEIISLKYDSYDNSDGLFIFRFDDMAYLYNSDGELVKKEKDINFFQCDVDYSCYYVNDNHYSFYDKDGELIYKASNNYSGTVILVDNYLFSNSRIVDIDNDVEYDDYDSSSLNCKNIYNFDDGKVWVLDTCNLTLDKYDSRDDYKDSLVKVYIEDTGYYMDYSYCSGYDAYLLDDNGVVVDECSSYFDISLASKDVFVYNNGKNTILFANGEKKSFDLISIIGDYIVINNYLSDDSYYVYDVNGNEINEWCLLQTYNNGRYICNDGLKKYLVNEKFEKVTDGYDDIVFYGNYILLKDNGKYAIYDKDLLTGFFYHDLKCFNEYVISYLDEGLEYIELGYGKELIDGTVIEEKKEIDNIKVLEIIKTYQLDEIDEIVLNNKELFYRYANLVINNDNLGDYKRQVLRLFKIIANNKEYLEDDYFFEKVKSLKIEDGTTIYGSKVSGTYDFYANTITLDDANDRTLYHELVHFLDYSLNEDGKFYYCGDKYMFINDINSYQYVYNEKCLRTYNYSLRWLIEAGAEYNTGKYLNNNLVTSYIKDNYVFNALLIIMGEDKVNEMFYSKNGDLVFFDFLLKNGYSPDQISEFNESLTSLISLEGIFTRDNIMVIYKYLTELYRKVYGNEWYSDDRMHYIISCLVETNDELNGHNLIYKAGNYNPSGMISFFDSTKNYGGLSGIIINGDKTYICDNGYISEYGYFVIDYDFKNKKVNHYDFYSYSSLYGIIN